MASIDFPRLIAAAAASTLGVLSLVVLAIALIAWSFFRRSDDRTKLLVFGGILVSGIGFGTATLIESGHTSAQPTPSQATPSQPSPPAADITGGWQDTDGFTYHFTRDGAAIAYIQYHANQRVGAGEGTIEGNALTYSFQDEKGGSSGNCTATVAPNGRAISGTCTRGGTNWPFTIIRGS